MQEALQSIPLHDLLNTEMEARLEYVKSRFGWVNYVFSESRPRSTRFTTKVFFCNVGNSTEGIEVGFSINEKVRQIRSKIGERIRVNLEDYGLTAVVGKQCYTL